MCPINYICTVFLLTRVRNITKVEALRKKKMLLIAVPLIARCSRVKPNSKKFRLNLWEKKKSSNSMCPTVKYPPQTRKKNFPKH